jgi:hypothetical protein
MRVLKFANLRLLINIERGTTLISKMNPLEQSIAEINNEIEPILISKMSPPGRMVKCKSSCRG